MIPCRPLAVTLAAVFALAVSPLAAPSAFQGQASPRIEEATIASVHAAMQAGTLTCRALVDHYLARIAAYSRKGPSLNAIVALNPAAAREADALDQRFARQGLTGPLHCVPVIVKDNLETIGLATTDGVLALRGFMPRRDATAVSRVKAAGAIVLAKGNMPDLGLDSLATISSLHGMTRNPYALDRVPAGSSGGVAVAIAANFGLVGIGTDTGSSIRGPASHNALVGLRPTMGLVSRAGMIPLNSLSDTVGAMTRTVEDAAILLQVMAGEDREDPATEASRGLTIPPYTGALAADGLRGARIGILRQAVEGGFQRTDPEVEQAFARALQDIKRAGAEIIDSVNVEQVEGIPGADLCRGLKYDLNEYLAKQGGRAPVQSLEGIIESGEFRSSALEELEKAQVNVQDPPDSEACKANRLYRQAVAAAVTGAMDALKLDALVYPTWTQPPQLIGSTDLQRAGQPRVFATVTGFPAMTVPMGFTRTVLPAGLSFLGRAWSEATLIRLAYSYEQATRHRRPPPTTPPLR